MINYFMTFKVAIFVLSCVTVASGDAARDSYKGGLAGSGKQLLFESNSVFISDNIRHLFRLGAGLTFRSDVKFDEVTVCTGDKYSGDQSFKQFVCPESTKLMAKSYSDLVTNNADVADYCCGPNYKQRCCTKAEFKELNKIVSKALLMAIIGVTVALLFCVVALGIYCIFKFCFRDSPNKFFPRQRQQQQEHGGFQQAVPPHLPVINPHPQNLLQPAQQYPPAPQQHPQSPSVYPTDELAAMRQRQQ